MDIPHNVKAKVPNSSKVLLSGPDYQQLTQFAAKIRSNRPPEPYNGKGVFIDNEQIQLQLLRFLIDCKVYNSVIYAFLTGSSGVLTSVFMKRIGSQVSNAIFVIC